MIMPPRICAVCGSTALVLVSLAGCSRNDTPASPQATNQSPASAPATERVVGPLTPADAAALGTMNARLREYVDLHIKLEAGLPPLPVDATPEQIDSNQRTLEQRVREARATAKAGDLFTPDADPVIRSLIAAAFRADGGIQLKASILDDNPSSTRVGVNARYPDSVPVSTVPPQLLQTLPKLSEDLEYRFIGQHLIILDVHAHVVADVLENVFPR